MDEPQITFPTNDLLLLANRLEVQARASSAATLRAAVRAHEALSDRFLALSTEVKILRSRASQTRSAVAGHIPQLRPEPPEAA